MKKNKHRRNPKRKLNKKSSLRIHREQTCIGVQNDIASRVTSSYVPSVNEECMKRVQKPKETVSIKLKEQHQNNHEKTKRSAFQTMQEMRNTDDHVPIVLVSPLKDSQDLCPIKRNSFEMKQLPRRISNTARRCSQTTSRASDTGSARSGRNSGICLLNSRFKFKGEVSLHYVLHIFFSDYHASTGEYSFEYSC